MKKLLKNLQVLHRIRQFEMDQIRQQLGHLSSDLEKKTCELRTHQKNYDQERGLMIEDMGSAMMFHSYEKWAQQKKKELETEKQTLEEKRMEIYQALIEKFEDSKKIEKTLEKTQCQLVFLKDQEEQKMLDHFASLRLYSYPK